MNKEHKDEAMTIGVLERYEKPRHLKFVKVERDCPYNQNIRDGKYSNYRKPILYDYAIFLDDKEIGLFRSHSYKRGYTLVDVDGDVVKREDSNRTWPVKCETKAQFFITYQSYGHLLPDDAELARRRVEKAEAKRLAAESIAAQNRLHLMSQHSQAMFDILIAISKNDYTLSSQEEKRVDEIIAAVNGD